MKLTPDSVDSKLAWKLTQFFYSVALLIKGHLTWHGGFILGGIYFFANDSTAPINAIPLQCGQKWQ